MTPTEQALRDASLISADERYIATLTDHDGAPYHLILLPGDNADATHAAQLEWAKSIGGDLPTRVEQALLWERARDQFKQDLYWSKETHHAESSWAWYQGFGYGGQYYGHKDDELRARAVRRIAALSLPATEAHHGIGKGE